jgi:hypothetical protein
VSQQPEPSHGCQSEAISQDNHSVADLSPFGQIKALRIFEMGFAQSPAGFAGKLRA